MIRLGRGNRELAVRSSESRDPSCEKNGAHRTQGIREESFLLRAAELRFTSQGESGCLEGTDSLNSSHTTGGILSREFVADLVYGQYEFRLLRVFL